MISKTNVPFTYQVVAIEKYIFFTTLKGSMLIFAFAFESEKEQQLLLSQ